MRILIADDNVLVRHAIRVLLSKEAAFEICGEATDGPQTLARVRELRPEVVLLDISMPATDGFQTARQIRDEFADVKILIVTQNDAAMILPAARRAGADACLDKSRLGAELVPALKSAAGQLTRAQAAR